MIIRSILLFVTFILSLNLVMASEYPQILKVPINIPNSEHFHYGFSINEFNGKLYLFVNEAGYSNQIYVLNKDSNTFDLLTDFNDQMGSKFQLRDTYNDNEQRLFMVFDDGTSTGKILVTNDMKNFTVAFTTNEDGFRSISKYQDTYVAGVANLPSTLFVSNDGLSWKKIKLVTDQGGLHQVNGFMTYKSELYIVANSGIYKTKDLSNAQLVFKNPDHTQIYAFNKIQSGLLIGTGWKNELEHPEDTISTLFYSRDGVQFEKIADTPETPLLYTLLPKCDEVGIPVSLLWGGYAGGGLYSLDFDNGNSQKLLEDKGSIYSSIMHDGKVYFTSYPMKHVISVDIGDNNCNNRLSIDFNTISSNGTESVSSKALTVDLSAATDRAVTVDYAVTGTATASGTDYTLANGKLTIAAGATTGTIIIASIVKDTLEELNETIIVTLSSQG